MAKKRKCKTCRDFGLLEDGPCPKKCKPNILDKRLGKHGKMWEVRLNSDKTLDEIVAGYPAKPKEKQTEIFFHLEQMSETHFWMAISMPDGNDIHVNLTSKTPINASYFVENVAKLGHWKPNP